MTRARFLALLVTATALAFVVISEGWSDNRRPGSKSTRKVAGREDKTIGIYSLSGLVGDDPKFVDWIVKTMATTIEPGSWQGENQVKYYAPKKILVIYQTPQVQAKVAEFLGQMEKAMAGKRPVKTVLPPPPPPAPRSPLPFFPESKALKPTARPSALVPAKLEIDRPPAEKARTAYHPKHRFIIWYEGEGVIDSNVVSLFRGLSGESMEGDLSRLFSTIVKTLGENMSKESKESSGKDENGEPIEAPKKMPEKEAGQDPAPDIKYTRYRHFNIPFFPTPGLRLRQLRLFVSADQGRTWQATALASPEQKYFRFMTDRDGSFWFTVQTEDQEGRLNPVRLEGAQASLKLIIDTKPPIVLLKPLPVRGGEVGVAWKVQDEHLDLTLPDALQLDCRRAGGEAAWMPLPRHPSANQLFWNPMTNAPLEVRLRIRDQAGNWGEAVTTVGLAGKAPSQKKLPRA